MAAGSYSQVVDGVAIYFGVMPAELVRGHPREHPESGMHGDPPVGESHLLVALFDERSAWLSTVLMGTKRMVGRVTASQIASASAASFFMVFTYGLTNCGAMSFTVCPSAESLRAQ